MKPINAQVARVASSVIAGSKLSGQVPHYPEDARANHISGNVVLRAIIGPDGHVHALTVMSAGDVGLALSALRAVRTWTYKPYLLDGEPTSVDTTITVRYDLN